MKLLHGALFGALLLAAPAVAMAASGGLAGAVSSPVTAAVPLASTNQPAFNFARAGTTSDASSSATAQTITAISQALSGQRVSSSNSAPLLANQRAGGGR